MSDIARWSDRAQFLATPVEKGDDGIIVPKVYLLSMNADPLGDVASMNKMYLGEPCRSLDDITDEERDRHFKEVCNTQLKAPFESVVMHFFIEGVDRSFTHQMVRQRTATYAQESLRFAVKGEPEFCMPPSIAELDPESLARKRWVEVTERAHNAYLEFVDDWGIPSEDARALLPHAIATRLHFVTNLRNLIDQAGVRLCTQAQFVWRYVFAGIVDAIRNYGTHEHDVSSSCWQYHAIADSMLFRPICYSVGHCPWNASFDRPCTIKERVERNAKIPRPPSEWGNDYGSTPNGPIVPGIRMEEWLLNKDAARGRED